MTIQCCEITWLRKKCPFTLSRHNPRHNEEQCLSILRSLVQDNARFITRLQSRISRLRDIHQRGQEVRDTASVIRHKWCLGFIWYHVWIHLFLESIEKNVLGEYILSGGLVTTLTSNTQYQSIRWLYVLPVKKLRPISCRKCCHSNASEGRDARPENAPRGRVSASRKYSRKPLGVPLIPIPQPRTRL